MPPSIPPATALRRPLLDAVVAHFEAATATAAARGELRTALIHSDANERNVLVDAAAAAAAAAAEQAVGGAGAAAAATGAAAGAPAGAASGGGIIAGLIDWGDASWQWLAAEVRGLFFQARALLSGTRAPCPSPPPLLRLLHPTAPPLQPANAAAYMMLLAPEGAAPLPTAAALVRGFEAEQPLRAAERRARRARWLGRRAWPRHGRRRPTWRPWGRPRRTRARVRRDASPCLPQLSVTSTAQPEH